MTVRRDILAVIESLTKSPVTEASDDRALSSFGMDSLDLANFFLALEDRFQISISDTEAMQLASFGAVVRLVEAKRGAVS